MKRYVFIFILIVIITFSYTLLFPIRIINGDYYHLAKYFNINAQPADHKIDGYFSIDHKECGYFSLDQGMVSYFKADNDQYLMAKRYGFVRFDKIGDKVGFYSPKGNLHKEISHYGYPYLSDTLPYVYLLKTNGYGFSFYSATGQEKYKEINFNSMITAINSDRSLNTLVSTLDSKSYLLNPQGKIEFMTESIDSRINIAKSSTISMDGKYLAIVSGLNPEVVEIIQRDTQTKIKKIKTSTHFNYQIYLHFAKNRLYYEGEEALHYYDLKKDQNGYFSFKGMLKEVKHADNNNLLILSQAGPLTYLYLYTPTGLLLYYNEFDEVVDNINFILDDCFYFRLNDKILKISQK